jgi:hypothetical protein
MLQVALLTFQVLAMPGSTWASVGIAHKLINNVMQVVATEKSETKQISASGLLPAGRWR